MTDNEVEVLTKRAADLEAELTAEREAHAATHFKNIVAAEFLRVGGRESAVDFMVENAAKVFAVDGTTQEPSQQNPGTSLSIAEWIQQQLVAVDFAFKPSKGSGAGPSRGGGVHRLGAYTRQNELRDPTQQQLGAYAADIANGKLKVVYS